MKVNCLSVRTQYAYLICLGIKDIENRRWQTNYRGRLYIHSSGKYDYYEIDIEKFPKKLKDQIIDKKYKTKPKYIKRLDDFYDNYLSKHYNNDFDNMNKYETYLKTHAIIGYVNLVDIIKNSKSKWAENNQYHWVLKNAKLFKKPILNIKGKLRIFELSLLPQEVKKGVLIWQKRAQEQPEEREAGEQH